VSHFDSGSREPPAERRQKAPRRSPIAPSDSRAAPVLGLQRLVGNRAVVNAVTARVQRQKAAPAPGPAAAPAPAPTQGSSPEQARVSAKRLASVDQDLRWRAIFGSRLSSWRQVIFRVSGALEAAHAGFAQAKQDQATFDTLITQIAFAGASIGFAAGFEPLLGGLLKEGKLGDALDKATKQIEAWENPVVAAVGTASNIVPAAKSTAGVGGGGPNLPSAMAFLTVNGEALEEQNQHVEEAFAKRAGERQSATDEAVLKFDLQTQEGKYASIDAQLKAASNGIENMKSASDVARILERHLWVAWLRERGRLRIQGKTERQYYEFDGWGSYIEDRFNFLGIAKDANVTLTGHFYSPNSPSEWAEKLLSWAGTYRDGIAK
jgi:hypothetical protein